MKKLMDPLYLLLNETSAVSLTYEIISCCFAGGIVTRESIDSKLGILCAAKTQSFVTHSDINLKCLGLTALSELVALNPEGASEYREIVIECLHDGDYTLRSRALIIAMTLMNETNVVSIVNKLLEILDGENGESLKKSLPFPVGFCDYAGQVVTMFLSAASRNAFILVKNELEWFVNTLPRMIPYCNDGSVGKSFVDVCIHLEHLRPRVANLIGNEIAKIQGDKYSPNDLKHMIWTFGEYVSSSQSMPEILDRLLKFCAESSDNGFVAACFDCIAKIVIRLPRSGVDCEALQEKMASAMEVNSRLDALSQEQGHIALSLLDLRKDTSLADNLRALYDDDLHRCGVGNSALPLQELNLTDWINPDLQNNDTASTVCILIIIHSYIAS